MHSQAKYHYGWVVVLACFLISGIGIGVLVNSLGTFIKPVSEAMGYTRAQFSIVSSLSCLTAMVSYPFWGSYFKTHSIRGRIISSSILLPLILFGYSCCQQLIHFYLCGILLGLLLGTVSTLPISAVIDVWFEDSKGLALGLATCGTGLGSMIMTPAISAVISQYGWRTAYRFVAIVIFLVVVPTAVVLLRDSPGEKHLEPYTTVKKTQQAAATQPELWGVTWQEALHQPRFRYHLIIAVCIGFVNNGTTNHIYAFLTDIGFDATAAALLISMQMLMLMIAKFSLGAWMDRAGIALGGGLSLAAYLVVSVGLLFAHQVPALALLYVPAAGLGAAYPAMGSAYITRNLFGNRDYRAVFGIVLSMVFLGNTLGTTVAGILYDQFHSYAPMWTLTAVLSACSVFFFWCILANRPRAVKDVLTEL